MQLFSFFPIANYLSLLLDIALNDNKCKSCIENAIFLVK